MDHDEHVSHLHREAAAFAVGLAAGGPDAHVAACPGWTTRDLAQHLGGVHRWAALALATAPDGPEPSHDGTPEDEGTTLAEWYDVGRDALVAALRSAGPDAACWTMAAPRTASFWSRRQAHETAVHRWDVEAAAGRPGPVDADLALDGVHEVLDTMLPRQVRLGRVLVTRDWVRLIVDGHELALATAPGGHHDGHHDGHRDDPVATVTGSAEEVLLLLWGRLRTDAVEVHGDRDELDAFLGRAHVP